MSSNLTTMPAVASTAATFVAPSSEGFSAKAGSLPTDFCCAIAGFITDREFARLSEVNKNWRSSLDEHEFQPPLYRVHREIRQKQKEVEGLQLEIARVEKEITAQQALVTKTQNSWSGYFLNVPFAQTLSKAVSQTKNELEKQESGLRALSVRKNGYEMNLQRRQQEIQALKGQIPELRYRELFTNLLGGEQAFMRLPVLQIPPSDRDYIDYISVDQMSSAVMRGVDCHGRIFFSVMAIKDSARLGQTFFQRYANTLRHVSDARLYGTLVDFSGYLIDNGRVSEYHQPIYKALGELIQSGKTTYLRPSPLLSGAPTVESWTLATKERT